MKRYWKNILLVSLVLFVFIVWGKNSLSEINPNIDFTSLGNGAVADTLRIDTTGVLPFQFKDEAAFEYPNPEDSSKLFLDKPSNIKSSIEYDPITGEYIFYEKVGDLNYRLPKTMSRKEFQHYDFNQSIKNYWRQRNNIQRMDNQGGLVPKLTIGGEAFNKLFGGNTIDIRPQGYIEVSFGYQVNETENPAISERLRKVPTFDFDQKIQMNVMGKIGDKMQMRVNYNTEATFDYENKMNLDYTGTEDEIIKKIEAGNVSLPLNGSLITGGSNLFGVKADMQFGKLSLSTVLSQNKGETTVVEMENGAQKKTFQIKASDYDANRHFFLAQYFRDHYDEALKDLPIVRSSITINKIEVWVTNKTGVTTNSRNLVAFMDLGEHAPNIYNKVPSFQENLGLIYPESVYPFNGANNLYDEIRNNYAGIREVANVTNVMSPLENQNFEGGQDFEKLENARLLSSSEYTVNTELGYISLNSSLNTDEVLAVAYNYTANGKTYQVGEFSTDGINAPSTLIVKLLKGTNLTPKVPNWKLMMKNIYSLNAYQLNSEDFVLDVLYQNDQTGNYVNYLPEGRLNGHILLNVMNLDNLNSQLDKNRDGVFDFIEGITVIPSNGRVIFPVLEPFGSHLRDSIGNAVLAKKYCYQTLYDSTRTVAEEDAEHNKFILKGYYKGSSSSEISVGSQNLAQGSVRVTAGGRTLVENVDYTVDYTFGTVKIINSGLLESGTAISVSTESQDLVSMQRKTLLGTHANYAFSDRFNLGATVMHMQERPLTQKVNYGEDPISNTMLGLDVNYNTQSQLLTTLVDKLPFLETKEPSTISFEGEYARLIPGHSNVIGSTGTVYIDDFEATKTSINLKSKTDWMLASTPQKQTALFPEASSNDLMNGYNRARLAWYIIDPILVRNTSTTPDHLKSDTEQRHSDAVREVYSQEIFPDKEIATGMPSNLSVFDLAFYPNEKGPYNFDTEGTPYSAGVNSDGTLRNPESRWGGIMREIETTDFEAANIEYIEFWMMDPTASNNSPTWDGGDLYFNLGDVSEDLLRDGRKSFENGLPTSNDNTSVDQTRWGNVSNKQAVNYEFSSTNREQQDLGFDGMSDEQEVSFYQSYLQSLSQVVDQQALAKAMQDPANDDYHYFRGSDYDQEQLSILERYKKFNGPEGNSTQGSESYSTTASTKPDIEDVNSDFTMNENERYFQYRISLRPEDMVLGKNFIADVKEGKAVDDGKGGTKQVKWYQFKVPVKSPEKTVGAISDLKSIRFLRMFLRGFNEQTVLRMATFDLVRADWRKYSSAVDENVLVDDSDTQFEISAVNIEENGSRDPVNYVLPPGIDRTIDPANPQLLQLNEQSLVLKVVDLKAGDAKASYKTMSLDMRNYKRIKMDVHAEAIEGYPLNDDDLCLFVRMGSDYNYNYYEYEVPLKLTAPGYYSKTSDAARLAVWPDENRINVALETFTNLKLARNAAMRAANSTVSLTDIYEAPDQEWNDGKNTVKIKGNPNLGNVEVMMIGIRHKKKTYDPGPKSAEVWVNELRLTGLNEDGGWAAIGRVSTRLADLGSVIVAGKYRSSGFGSIDQNVNQRATDDLGQYDVSANLELGKFFGEKSGVQIPMYFGYSKNVSNPKYNPLDPDITMDEALKNLKTGSERDSLKRLAQDYETRKSINFTNVKVDKTNKSGKPRFYDPTNFSMTYSYNEVYSRNVDTEYNIEKTYQGMFAYNFNARPAVYEPFKKSKLLSGKALQFIRDFNISPMPSQISFRTTLYRYYNETQLRNLSNPNLIIEPTYDKDFILNRYFDLRYNLTRSLRVDFSSQNTSRIDEPAGRINRDDNDYEWKRDSIVHNLLRLGRPTDYQHTFKASYQAPINRLPLLDWTNLSVLYQSMYNWDAGPLSDGTINIGNTIQNTRNSQLNGQLNLVTLYNKIDFLKKVNQKYGQSSKTQQRMARAGSRNQGQNSNAPKPGDEQKKNEPVVKNVQYKSEAINLKAGTPKSIFHKLSTEDVQVAVVDSKGKKVDADVKVVNQNRVSITVPTDVEGAKVNIRGKVIEKNDPFRKAMEISSRLLMSVRNVSLSYSNTDGTILPGFLPEPKVFGLGRYTPNSSMFGNDLSSSMAPGIPFLLGWQDENFARKAAEKGWITKDSVLNSPYIMSKSETYMFRANIEPMPDLKIDVTANRTYSEKMSEYYKYNTGSDQFDALSHNVSGNFTMSINTFKTAFSKMVKDANGVEISKPFQKFMDNRIIIANRLDANRVANVAENYKPGIKGPDGVFPDGYSATSQQVLIPAFLAAYTGQDANNVPLSPFPSMRYMRPNWRISYEGLASQIKGLNNYVKSLNFTHLYRSSYTVGSFISNLEYDETLYGDGFNYVRNATNDFLSPNDISSVTITEQFSPLINIDVTWLNDLETRAEIKRTRNLNLSMNNNQLTEILSNEYVFGMGYRFTHMDLIIKTKQSQKAYSNDLNVRADLSFRKNRTILWDFENGGQLTAGQDAITLKTTADYMLSDRFQLRLYYDKVLNRPKVGSFNTSTTNMGVSFRFTLAQ